MKKILIIILTFHLCLCFADGPPIEDGNISVPHQTINLTKKQIKQAEMYRYIKLESKQIKELQKLTNTKIIWLLELITDPYNDCACDLEFYGLWSKNNEVQIPNYCLEYLGDNDYSEVTEEYRPKSFSQINFLSNSLNIGIKGDIFQNAKMENNLSILMKNILTDKKIKYKKTIWIETPPLTNIETAIKVQKTFSKLHDYFSNKHFEVFSYFSGYYYFENKMGLNKLPVYYFHESTIDIKDITNGCSLKCGSSWNLSATSTGKLKNKKYNILNISDNSLETIWVEGVPGYGINEEISFSNFKHPNDNLFLINGFIIENGFVKNQKLFESNARVKSFILKLNGETKYYLKLLDTRKTQEVFFPKIIVSKNDIITLKIIDIYGSHKYKDTVITTLMPYYKESK